MKNLTITARRSASQEDRFLSALDFDYAKIDERSFEDLLLFTAGLSRLINFYNLDNQVEGDWSDFLTDEVVVLATMTEVDPNLIENRFKTYTDKAALFNRKEKKLHYLKKGFEEIYNAALLLNSWFIQFKYIEQFANIQLTARNEIFNAIVTKLSAALIQLKAIDEHALQGLDFAIDLDYTQFDSSWDLFKSKEIEYKYDGNNLSEKIKYVIYDLKPIFQQFYETLIYLKNKAKDFIAQSLQHDTHYPEIALLIAFLKIYEYSQENINQISKRFLEFYYQKVLAQKHKSPIFDKVFVQLVPTDNTLFAEVFEGHEFVGGEYENGDNIIYKADNYLQVNKAAIQKIHTIFLDNRMLEINRTQKKLITNILSADIDVEQISPNKNKQKKKAFATFGENQSYKSAHEKTMKNAFTGFAVTSPSLFLSEGKREIFITLHFSHESFKTLTQQIKELGMLNNEPENEVFIKSFLDAFQISITTEEGWLPISKYVITRGSENFYSKQKELRLAQQASYLTETDVEHIQCLQIGFDLEANEPAFTAYNQKIHEGYFQTNLPLIKCILNSNSYIYPYSLLQDLVLEKISIDTQSFGVKDLNLQSQIGELSANSPFYPFGSAPSIGSYMLIGKNEIFQKSLEKLNVNIEWFNLPREKDGFYGYYLDYDAGIDNASFEVTISILDGGRWKPENLEEQQSFKLFRTISSNFEHEPAPAGQLSKETNITNIDLVPLTLPANFNAVRENLVYSNTILRGFIKLELSKPDVVFGNTLYPAVLSEIVMDNAKGGGVLPTLSGKKEKRPLPNQPYAPQIKSLSLDYASSSVISLTDRSVKADKSGQRGQYFHIYPFGDNLVYPNNAKQTTNLLPLFHFEGAMLIGLANVNVPQTVSILFEMSDSATITSEEKLPIIEWSYLVNDEWVALSDTKILRDETKKFIKTGIIALELPQDMQKGNTILDPDLYWLRIAAVENIGTASQTIHITTQVLTATLLNLDDEGTHLNQALPAFTINSAVTNIIGVQEIIQSLPSFDGMSAENDKQFYTRISERLRHKQRAISTWDYERLVLEKFPAIGKVTCLANMSSKKLKSAGSVLIVVMPQSKDENKDNLELKASSELLLQIKAYLQSFTSPFVKLEVRNPNYEKVKIICSVKFAEGFNYGGFYIQKLNDEINRYLKGGMLANSKSIELGGKINSSDLLSYMRTLVYIDFITQFSMVQIAQDYNGKFTLLDTAKEENAKSFLQATMPWSILIPAEDHQITILDDKEEIKSSQAGFGNLELGDSFVVNE